MQFKCRYETKLWNQHLAILEMIPKTNNTCEGNHNGLRSLIPLNSGLWTVLAQFKKESMTVSLKTRDAALSSPKPTTSRKSFRAQNATKLKNLVERFDNFPTFYEFFLLR